MIAIIGKIGSGKSTFINFLQKDKYKTLVCDDFLAISYLKDNSTYNAVNSHFGTKLNNAYGLDKNKIRTLYQTDDKEADKFNQIIEKIIKEELIKNNYDFVEIPLLIDKNIDYSDLFSSIIWINNSEKQRQQNIIKALKKPETVKIMDLKNDPKEIFKKLKGEKSLIKITTDNIKLTLQSIGTDTFYT